MFLSIPHVYKLSIPYMDKRFLSICHIDNFSTCGIDIVFVYIRYGQNYFLSKLHMDNVSTSYRQIFFTTYGPNDFFYITYIDQFSTCGMDKEICLH